MVIDTSAVIAILQSEPTAARLSLAIYAAPIRLMSAASIVEAGIVVQLRLGEAGERELDALLLKLHLDVAPVTSDHAALARGAFRRFGKGNHPARLNFGDCFSYALARASGEPLLFVGDDFSRTDNPVAQY